MCALQILATFPELHSMDLGMKPVRANMVS